MFQDLTPRSLSRPDPEVSEVHDPEVQDLTPRFFFDPEVFLLWNVGRHAYE